MEFIVSNVLRFSLYLGNSAAISKTSTAFSPVFGVTAFVRHKNCMCWMIPPLPAEIASTNLHQILCCEILGIAEGAVVSNNPCLAGGSDESP